MATSKPTPVAAAAYRANFHGDGGSLFGIMIVNLLLTIVTLGIYSFWAKVKVRRFLYSQTEFAGDRFAYHGTGKELFIGALKALGVFVGFYVILGLVGYFISQGLALALIYIGIAALIPLALYGSMRYAMSRTSWRGIHFSFRGGLGECYKTFLGGIFLTIVTLGVYMPFFQANMRRYWTNHTYFGDTKFAYDGKGKDLVWHFLLAVLLTIPTLYLYWVWYGARKIRYDWSHTSFATGRFSSTVSGGAILWLVVSNLLLLVVTLGFAIPWIMIRNIRFMCERTSLSGPIAWSTIVRDPRAPKVGATGEGLADGLDVGVAV